MTIMISLSNLELRLFVLLLMLFFTELINCLLFSRNVEETRVKTVSMLASR